MRHRNAARGPVGLVTACAGLGGLLTMVASTACQAAQSRTFVVTFLITASNYHEGDCAGGMMYDRKIDTAYRDTLKLEGYSAPQIDHLMAGVETGGEADKPDTADVVYNRARVNGQPANAYTHPLSVPLPPITYSSSKFAYGFNLSGLTKPAGENVEDPDTKQANVDNRFARATGCMGSYAATPPDSPPWLAYKWNYTTQALHAIILTISADDLTKDGPAIITVKDSLDHLNRDVNGQMRLYDTFRLDPDPQWHGEFRGRIENSVFESDQPGFIRMMGDIFWLPEFTLSKARIRLDLHKPDQKISGEIGGYENWKDIFYGEGESGVAAEGPGGDLPTLYRALRENADYDPDPATGMNRAISITYMIEASPAFAVPFS